MKMPWMLGVTLLAALALVEGTAAQDVDSGPIEPGESFEQTFSEAGRFDYHCHPHPWMLAQLTIGERPEGATPTEHTVRIVEPSSDSSTWTFDPDDRTIHAGDTVTWINEGTAMHTVTGSMGSGHHDHDHDHEHETHTEDSPTPLIVLPLSFALLLARRSD